MNQQNTPRDPFLSKFIPGLVVGLIVGGLAGAFISPLVADRGSAIAKPPEGTTKAPAKPGSTSQDDSRDRQEPSNPPAKPAEAAPDAKPADTKPAEATPAEAKPAEPKPAEAKPAEAPKPVPAPK